MKRYSKIQKVTNHGPVVTQLEKKHGFRHCERQVFDTETHIRLGIHSPQAISVGEQTCSGLRLKWDINGQRCFSVTTAHI